jgi:hypothetical protein
MLFGRIAQTTTQYIDVTLKQRGVQKWQNSGERWLQRMIQNIWDTFLSLWNNRQERNHLRESYQEQTRHYKGKTST